MARGRRQQVVRGHWTIDRVDLDDLLQQTSRGDTTSYARLYDQTSGMVHGIARRVLVAPAHAEEVTQEVFADVWRLAPRFDPERGGAVAWISTIAHRRAVDRVRQEQAHRDRTERVGSGSHERDYDDVAETVELQLEHDRVRSALGSISDLSREAIEHAFYGGWTYREVAEQLGIPVGTVKTRIRSGLRQLARQLQTRSGEAGDE